MFNMRLANGKLANYDEEAQIHYGAISLNSVSPEALDLGGNNWTDESYEACKEEAMREEGESFDEEAFGDGYMGDGDTEWSYTDDEYQLVTVLTNCLLVIKSPYFTHARYCSPCLPNAGDCDTPDEGGVKTYCLGREFFDEYNPCPYPVYRVTDGVEVKQ